MQFCLAGPLGRNGRGGKEVGQVGGQVGGEKISLRSEGFGEIAGFSATHGRLLERLQTTGSGGGARGLRAIASNPRAHHALIPHLGHFVRFSLKQRAAQDMSGYMCGPACRWL